MIKHKPKRRTRKIEQFKNVCKKITTFMFSRVGLCFVLVGYVVIGGFIFQSIEGTYEAERAKNKTLIGDIVNKETDELVNDIWNMTKYELVFHKKNYTNKLKEKLKIFQKSLSNALKVGYKGSFDHNTTKWTFPGSIVYSVTIVTSIGYGHITCETDAGKITTIFYALFGIPIMILCLANIGSSMANLFRFIYGKVCCGYCNYIKRRNIRMKTTSLSGQMTSYDSHQIRTLSGNIDENPSYPNNSENQHSNNYTYSAYGPSSEKNVKTSENTNSYDMMSPGAAAKYYNEQKPSLTEGEIIDYYDDEMEAHEHRKITVPISVSLFILFSYIIFGGILFKTLEGWDLLDSVYFCFITLTTIGLGDFVPGNSINDTDTQAELKLFGCSLYLLMGLSLISMCFSLMQEEVSAKSRKLAVRLGIIDDPNYW